MRDPRVAHPLVDWQYRARDGHCLYVNFKKTLNKSSLHHISAISCPDLMWDVAITHPIGHAAALGELQQEFKEFEWLQSN